MRLLHTKNLTLEEFVGGQTPHYAILSHTWEKEEVTLQDMKTNKAKKLKGYTKVKNACSIALADGFKYIWIDTCCIDKTSSAELSEALNSMYRWYEEAGECYAYLADILPGTVDHVASSSSDGFRKSRWFTRGWTLQELIAPSTVIFLDMNWKKFGSKSSLQELISEITGIPGGFLLGDDLGYASVAQRMSWASERETTRVEDQAYCLLGIFGIFMPMLYGEGERAFIRLQEEIIRISDDHSLFAWISTKEDHDGILASSPSDFANCNNIIQTKPFTSVNNPPTISSRGIRLSLSFKYNDEEHSGLAVLNCTETGKDRMRFAISLTDIFLPAGDFERVRGSIPTLVHLKDINPPHYFLKDLYVKQWRSRRNRKWEDVEKFIVKLEGIGGDDIASYISHLHTDWELHDGMMITTKPFPHTGIFGRILFLCRDGTLFQVLLRKSGKFFSMEIHTDLNVAPENGLGSIFIKHEQDRIVRSLDGGKHVHIPIKMRVLMLRKRKYLVGMMEVSYSSVLPGMWIEHVAFLDGEMTPLLYAAKRGYEAMVKLLLDKGAYVAATDSNKWTPLHWASRKGYVEIVQVLLDKGANVAATDIDGKTPLHHASENGNFEIVKVLLDKGADVVATNSSVWTPLHWASMKGHVEVVKVLLDNGADVAVVDYRRMTPLEYASMYEYNGVVKLLNAAKKKGRK